MRIAHGSISGDRDALRDQGPSDPNSTIREGRVREDAINVGAALREARQRRATSLQDIAKVTKIRVAILRAIETNRRDELPEAVFLRGFVRAYAREVGLDPNDTVRRYFDQFKPVVNVVESAVTSEPIETQVELATSAQDAIDRDDRRAVRSQWLVIAIVLVVSLVGYSAARWWGRPLGPTPETSHSDRATEVAASSSSSRTADRSESGTAGSLESTTVGAAEGRVLHLDIRTGGSCWLSATADGARVVHRLMHAGEQLTLDADQEAVLRVGDPAAFTLSINGMVGRSLGPASKAVTAHITSENYREFLRH